MSEFRVVDVPQRGSGSWKAIAAALVANRGKAVFVSRNGSQSRTFRNGCLTLVRPYLRGERIHSTEQENGATLWLDEEQP